MSPSPRKFFQRASTVLIFLLVSVTATAQSAHSSRVVTIEFQSNLVKTKLPYRVLLPPDYENSEKKTARYPVLYLLHGLTGHFGDWSMRTRLAEHAAGYQIITVMPEGNNGWYTDSAISPSEKYESYIIKELIPDVERRFRVNRAREARAIAGLSMGGYGAIKFAVKYPDKFIFAASMSGTFDVASWTNETLRGFEWIMRTIDPVFGPPGSPTRAANDVIRLYREFPAEQLGQLPFLYLDCGTEDPLLPSSRTFADVLLARKIPHEYRSLPGRHDWVYWDRQIVEVLRVAATRMKFP